MCAKFGSDWFRNVDLYKVKHTHTHTHKHKLTFNFIYKSGKINRRKKEVCVCVGGGAVRSDS
jgi:hypothetical protein